MTSQPDGQPGKSTSTEEFLLQRKYTCPECTSSFKRPEHLKRHQRGHDSNKKFGCPICGKGFARSDIRARHLAVHAGHPRRKGPANKGRACYECAKARDWCSRDLPCVRCTAKGLCCRYPVDSRSRTAKAVPRSSFVAEQTKPSRTMTTSTSMANNSRRASYPIENFFIKTRQDFENLSSGVLCKGDLPSSKPLLSSPITPITPNPRQTNVHRDQGSSLHVYPPSPLIVSTRASVECETENLIRREHPQPIGLLKSSPSPLDPAYPRFQSPSFIHTETHGRIQTLLNSRSFHNDCYDQDDSGTAYSNTPRDSTESLMNHMSAFNSSEAVEGYDISPTHAEIDALSDYPEFYLTTETVNTPLTPVHDRGMNIWDSHKNQNQVSLLSLQTASPTLSQATSRTEESERRISPQLYDTPQYLPLDQPSSPERHSSRPVNLKTYEIIAKNFLELWHDDDNMKLLSSPSATSPLAFNTGRLRLPPQTANQHDFFLGLYFQHVKDCGDDDATSFGIHPSEVGTFVESPFG
ncbi:hypothetical protein F5Y16DRAFT_359471 [Xylariaceae sp. FL0255]|nr:hypothetical protein F5Y16DRAFT_359471 [Xylariaceae sp. FL0255]